MSGKNFVVVGGSSGIGLGIVRRLVATGANVTAMSRQRRELESIPEVSHIELDITQGELSKELLPEVIHGIAYCPGSINLKSFRGLKPENFREDFELNVVGAVKAMQAALPGLKKAGNASVLLFSTVAVGQGIPMHASISSAKGAVEGLARTMAAEFSPGIRVNCVAPALTDTPLAERFFSTEEKAAALAERYPMKRTGTVEDLASIGEFLLSDQSSWITGQVIHVDGGMSSIKK